MAKITGGSNRNNADVDNTNRLLTRSVVRSDGVDAGFRGDAFFILTPEIELTTDGESAAWVYQNDEDRDLVVTSTLVSSNLSTGGTDQVFENRRFSGIGLELAGGTGTPVPTANKIFGSNQVLQNTSELGQEGATVTTPTVTSPQFVPAGLTFQNNIFLIIPKGVSLGVLITPPTGNTSMIFTFLLECFLREELE